MLIDGAQLYSKITEGRNYSILFSFFLTVYYNYELC